MTLSGFLLTLEVGLAGSLGALSRYLLFQYPKSGSLAPFRSRHLKPLIVYTIQSKRSTGFVVRTLFINVSGSFVVGLLFALAARDMISSTLQLILTTGFLGGYTTFSTMSWEIVQLARGGERTASMLYLVGSIVLGLAAATIGLLLGWRI